MGFKEKDPIRRMSPGVKNFSVFNGLQRVVRDIHSNVKFVFDNLQNAIVLPVLAGMAKVLQTIAARSEWQGQLAICSNCLHTTARA